MSHYKAPFFIPCPGDEVEFDKEGLCELDRLAKRMGKYLNKEVVIQRDSFVIRHNPKVKNIYKFEGNFLIKEEKERQK